MEEKLYTFVDENDEIIEEVRASSRDEAVEKSSNERINGQTDYYSESVE